MPLPGTSMYDYCMENGLLDKDFNIDKMNWRKANMINTPVSPEDLESIRDKAWEEVNSDEWKKNRRGRGRGRGHRNRVRLDVRGPRHEGHRRREA